VDADLKYSIYVIDHSSSRAIPAIELHHTDGFQCGGSYWMIMNRCISLGINPVVEVLTPAGFEVVMGEPAWTEAVRKVYDEEMMEGVVKVRVQPMANPTRPPTAPKPRKRPPRRGRGKALGVATAGEGGKVGETGKVNEGGDANDTIDANETVNVNEGDNAKETGNFNEDGTAGETGSANETGNANEPGNVNEGGNADETENNGQLGQVSKTRETVGFLS
jgi:hypothetical protein